jgi:intraflagellar transport protein 140
MLGAVAAYEKSSAFTTEVPKMLLHKIGELEKYAHDTEDKAIKRWYAQYAESRGDVDSAMQYYEQCGDELSLVRRYCAGGQIEKAIEIVDRTENRAACFHIARHYERIGDIKEALNFYDRARCFNHGVRLAKANKMDNELMHLALQSSQEAMLDAAKYYEHTAKLLDKAISLYYKGGNLSRAIDLCFQVKQFNLLKDIASSLDAEKADPRLLRRCAEFFMEHGQFEKAVRMMIAGKRVEEVRTGKSSGGR